MKTTVGAFIFVTILIILATMFSVRGMGPSALAPAPDNVQVVDGKQIVAIAARGGYTPKVSVAKAGIPTVIRMNTSGTYDCSIAVVIPSIGYRKNLPMTGTTEIEVPSQKAGTKLQGLCAMGMYNFVINFD